MPDLNIYLRDLESIVATQERTITGQQEAIARLERLLDDCMADIRSLHGKMGEDPPEGDDERPAAGT